VGELDQIEKKRCNIPIGLIDLGTGVNEMVRRRVGFGSAVYIRRTIT